ncbi:MAG TPA: hypothetical protein VHU24_06835 [Solirubrobacterales bacterium]|nr:hypothetical protein [Solirubrobacterales bacterium]
MRWRIRAGLLRLPGGFGYRIARALRVEKPVLRPIAGAATDDVPASAPLTVELGGEGRSKRLRVRAAGDIWSQDFRDELARDRRFEASLVWRELAILVFIAVILAARTITG